MEKKTIVSGITLMMFLSVGILGVNSSAWALNYETEVLLKLLEKKGVIDEDEAQALRQDMEKVSADAKGKEFAQTVSKVGKKPSEIGAVKGIRSRYEVLDKIRSGIGFSGAIEVEAGWSKVEAADGEEEDSSALELAAAEFAVDAGITENVKGHVLFKYEEDEDVFVDEAFIMINAEDACTLDQSCGTPFFGVAGKLYVPFGAFESHFASDPLTLELGEARETAAVTGVGVPWVTAAAGIFNGDIKETGDDDNFNNFFATAVLHVPEEIAEGWGLRTGVSWISNIADSNGLTDFMAEAFTTDEAPFENEVQSLVQGFSAFVSLAFLDQFFVEAEYLGALDSFDENPDFEPQAWNLEFAYAPVEAVELAVRYGGSDKSLNFLPETIYGGVVTYSLFENTSLALEYQYGEYENDDEEQSVTAQLAVEF
jgi:hypothetical protein